MNELRRNIRMDQHGFLGEIFIFSDDDKNHSKKEWEKNA